jgi:hypothetical protein
MIPLHERATVRSCLAWHDLEKKTMVATDLELHFPRAGTDGQSLNFFLIDGETTTTIT